MRDAETIEIPFRNSCFANAKFSWDCQDGRLSER